MLFIDCVLDASGDRGVALQAEPGGFFHTFRPNLATERPDLEPNNARIVPLDDS